MAKRRTRRVRIRGRLLTEAETRRRARRIHQNALKRREAARNDPSRITQPLTPKLLDRELDSAVRQKFRGQERQLEGEQRISDAQQRAIDGAFDLYAKRLQDIEQRTKDAYGKAGQKIDERTQASAAQAEQQRQALSAAQKADAEKRGATVDPSLDATAQQAAAARRAIADSFGNLVSTQGANQGAYLLDKERIGERSRIDEKGKEGARRRLIEQAIRDLGAEKGDFRIQYKADARDRERKYGLERAAFDLDAYEARQEAAADRSKARADAREDRRKARKDRQDRVPKGFRSLRQFEQWRDKHIAHGHNVTSTGGHTIPGKGKGKGGSGGSGGSGGGRKNPFTPTQRNNAKRTFRQYVDIIRDQGVKRGRGQTALNYLVDEHGAGSDRSLARAAVMTALYGGVDQKTRNRIYRDYGIYLRLSGRRGSNRRTSGERFSRTR